MVFLDRTTESVNNTLAGAIERLQFAHARLLTRVARWHARFHMARIPATRYTHQITVVLLPEVGFAVSVPGTMVGVVWKAVLSYVHQPNGLRYAKRVRGAFWTDTSRVEQIW